MALPHETGVERTDDRNGIKVLDKTFAILNAFSPEEPYLSAQELSLRLRISKSTVHRILAKLEQHRMIHQDETTHRYTLGIAARELSATPLWREELKAVALGPMRELRDATRETIGLYVQCSPVEHEAILFVDSPMVIRPWDRVGRPNLFGRGSASRVFLSFTLKRSGREGLEALLRALPSEAIAVPIDQLTRDVESVLEQGVALNAAERFPDAASVAAPIVDSHGNGFAVISVFGPTSRLDEQRQAQLAPTVREVADRISRLVRPSVHISTARSDTAR